MSQIDATSQQGNGKITGRYGSQVELELENGSRHRATARRKLQHIVCGDRVAWEYHNNDYTISKIHPRKNSLTRQYFRGTAKTIAANIDRILIIASVKPEPDWSIVDNLLVTANTMDASAIILIHKTDLGVTTANQTIADDYHRLGYQVLKSSIRDNQSINQIAGLLNSGTSVIVGQSGAGKTTLINKLIPHVDAATQAVSETSGLGQHTTSMALLYHLPGGGELIDSPGIRDFTPLTLEPHQYQYGFAEFSNFIGQCRFHNCLHRKEPGCAVKQALKTGDISQRRYDAYAKLLDDAEAETKNPG